MRWALASPNASSCMPRTPGGLRRGPERTDQAAEFFNIALDHGVTTTVAEQAELLELLADEYYIIDRLPEAIAASERALGLRKRAGDIVGVSVNHRLLSGLPLVQRRPRQRRTSRRRARSPCSATMNHQRPPASSVTPSPCRRTSRCR